MTIMIHTVGTCSTLISSEMPIFYHLEHPGTYGRRLLELKESGSLVRQLLILTSIWGIEAEVGG